MDDPSIEKAIQENFTQVTHTFKQQVSAHSDGIDPEQANSHEGARAAFCDILAQEVDAEEEEGGLIQPKRWWFTSTAFPLIAGTFGPLANLLSVCALVQTWRVEIPTGGIETSGNKIKDPWWLVALNSLSLLLALIANLLLLFNFARRVRYSIAQPLTITLWYMASILLIVPISLTKRLTILPPSTHACALSQSYYYALISATLYTIISSLLMLNLASAYIFHAYPPSFSTLTFPQRTLMLQTISFTCYLALGAGMFAALEGWTFVDGVYWADYTLLTIGLGTDFPLQTTAARALLVPYAAGGITLIGLVVHSVRDLILERGKARLMRRTLDKQRRKCVEGLEGDQGNDDWKKHEFEMMRRVERNAERTQKFFALGTSFFAFLIVWLGGALVFWFSEQKPQHWTYFESLYFTYTSLLTLGYGDYYPYSNSGKPFFVVWSLIAVPTVTVLISNMSDTTVGWLKDITLWLAQRSILPERVEPSGRGNISATQKRSIRACAHRDLNLVTERENDVLSGDKVTKECSGNDEDNRKRDVREKGRKLQGLSEDVEKLGSAVEKAEWVQGRGGSVAAQIAREIRGVARDVGQRPPRKYGWEEWIRWLELLRHRGCCGKGSDMGWTWLGEGGPLCCEATETEWVLSRLCTRLEVVLQQELDEIACASAS